ncbi:MAG: EamA family transporter [Propionibacteriaceae bacterium]|jgi:inner membrane transporter RhtA|nr:EamA family transporter [Propionibacteriaceae bacterium]
MRKALLMTLGSIVSMQLGSSLAKTVFPTVGPLAMAWLRLIAAGAILAIIVRPRLRGHSRQDWLALAWYVLALAGMNVTFYQAIARIPIGLTVTIEFLGPLVVALLKARGLRDLPWIGLAGVGVVILGWSPGSANWAGIGFSVLAAICWGAYILAAPHVGRHWHGAEPVAWANLTGAVVLTAPVLMLDHERLNQPWIWGAGLGVALLSSVLPYALELHILRTLDQRIFSILMSLEPAFAALFALLILGEALTPVELVAMACVIVASAGITWSVAEGPTARRATKMGTETKEVTQDEPEPRSDAAVG